MNGNTPACTDCTKKNCVPDFTSCSSLAPPSKQYNLLFGSKASKVCTDDDLNIWKTKGKNDFEDMMTKCGKQCWGEKSYSSACADCFGDLGQCTRDNCMLQCEGGNTP